jgi:hypothetical protein
VPEYDAFGREVGEDTLGQWRQGSGALPEPERPPPEPRATPTPAPTPAAVTAGDPLGGTAAPAPRASAPRVRRRGRRRGGKLILLLVVGYLGFQLIGGLADRVRDVADTITVPKLSPPTPPTPAEQPTGLGPRSLLRPAAFERALADIRRRDIGRLENLRVAPERIDATLITRRGTLVNVQVSATEGYRRFSESGPGFTATDPIAFGRLDPNAPRRLTRAAAERLGRPVSTINYLVPSRSDGKVTWGAYFKNGAIFLADARGRITRRIS